MEQDVQQILEEAFVEDQNIPTEGKIASYTPELAKADSSNLGCCIMNADGSMYKTGDYNVPSTMQSTARIFSLTLALQTSGYDHTFSKVDMESTGDRSNSILQLKLKDWRPSNLMINTGAIVTTNCIAAVNPFGELLTLVGELCGNPRIQLNKKMYHSEKWTSTRNRSIAYLLKSDHVLDGEPEDTPNVYFRICSVMYMAKGLAHYAMILLNKGVGPKTGECLLDADIVRIMTTLMMLYGTYDESGKYAIKIGLPSKNGVGGGIVVAGQNSMGIGTFGLMPGKKGNSVGGERILQYLSERLGYHISA